MIKDITFIENFWNDDSLFDRLVNEVNWNKEMRSRWTACFGQPYNHTVAEYEFLPMWSEMNQISEAIETTIGFRPNNCLLNYYFDGQSRMGFHADTTIMLEEETGIAILSLGAERIFRVRRIEDKEDRYNYKLPSGSLLYMTNEMQKDWEHGIPRSKVEGSRISMTFRKMNIEV